MVSPRPAVRRNISKAKAKTEEARKVKKLTTRKTTTTTARPVASPKKVSRKSTHSPKARGSPKANRVPPPPSDRGFTCRDFTMQRQIGRGAFGTIRLAEEKRTKRKVVLKILRKKDMQEARFEDQVRREVELHTHLVHPHIIRAYAFFQDNQYMYLVLEYASQGSLKEVLKHRPLKNEAPRIIRQLCLALQYLHDHDILHRDVKLENILLDESGAVKLADLGWAVRTKKRRTTVCGTEEYFAPEVVAKRPYGPKVDVWCVGVVAHELLLGRVPDRKLSEEDARAIPALAADFLRTLLSAETQRPSIEEVLAHPWLA